MLSTAWPSVKHHSLDRLDQVDWKTIESWKWGGRWLLSDSDIKRRKQAEFLVHERFPWSLISSVAVMNESMRLRVVDTLTAAGQTTAVTIRRNWYYNSWKGSDGRAR